MVIPSRENVVNVLTGYTTAGRKVDDRSWA